MMPGFESYDWLQTSEGDLALPRTKSAVESAADEPFGKRLARIRKQAGYSQRSLADELGISYRVVAYYEAQTEHPPTHLLPAIADALGVTADQLLGREPVKKRKAPTNERLLRQLRQVEKLPPRARQSVLEHIEGLVAKYGKE